MILRQIQAGPWRCFDRPLRIGPFADGLNVVYAPNATGKSTIFEAMRRCLLDHPSSTSGELSALRPWGRQLAPAASIEFEHDGAVYRLTKRFLDEPAALLEKIENGKASPLADSPDTATEAARQLLDMAISGRSVAGVKDWGMLQVLWVPQGAMAATALGGEAMQNIHRCLDGQLDSAAQRAILDRVEKAYLKIFTPSGKLKTGAEASQVVRLGNELAEARKKLESARARHGEFESAGAVLADMRQRRQSAERERAQLVSKIQAARQQAGEYSEMLALHDKTDADLKAIKAQLESIKQKIDLAASADRDLSKAQEDIAKLNADLPALQAEFDARKKLDAQAQADLTKANELGLLARQARQLAGDAAKYAAAQREYESTRKPPADAKVSVELRPAKKVKIEVVKGSPAGTRQLQPDKPVRIEGNPDVILELPGVGRLIASTESAGTDADDPQKAGAEKTLESLKAALEESVASHPDWHTAPPDSDALARSAAQADSAFANALSQSQQASAAVQDALRVAERTLTEARTNAAQLKERIASLQTQLAGLNADGMSPEQRQEKYREMAFAYSTQTAALDELQTRLKQFPADPRRMLVELEKNQETLEAAVRDNLQEEARQEGRLAALAAEGTYSTLAESQELADELELQLACRREQADAVGLLYRTVRQCGEEFNLAFTAPVAERALQIYRRLAGEKYLSISLNAADAGLTGLARTDAPRIAPDDLSGGEKEQLYLAVRLALAEIIAGKSRQLLVLDDVLVSTDQPRMNAALTILDEFSARLQIVILTCHQERYRPLPNANFIDLSAAVGE
ncbi:MAG: AAA family ATPase [Planctomycetes bacterium]|nr:AAA family ATPase [Planctomycetota bacterium]